ncbi:unnamed protein product [Lactuca saligna]|uniref:Ubiquitin-like domain-containing protein n=1 Tax=Lactuca saligna TaxID=75948 RepID=A0AA35Z212_LACSI|nr:unnamed protein product [Lactuca saligna]
MRILAEDKADSADFDKNHKFSFEINGSVESSSSSSSSSTLSPFSPLLLIETLSRKSFSYGKLPLIPIKLTVLKLDGSSFDITVAKNPTVAQLKQAVEDAFSHFPKHGTGKVSWSHVWAQFCLSFEGQKLLDEQDSIRVHGIKDGDQLQFVRHTSVSYNLVKERSKKEDYKLEESEGSPTKQEQNDLQDKSNQKKHEENEEEESCEDISVNITCQCSWAHLIRRLFSNRKQKDVDTSYEELITSKSS